MRSISLLSWVTLLLELGTVGLILIGAVGGLLGQLVHAVEHVVDLGEGASAVCTREIPSLALSWALSRPVIWARIFSEMARPAASSPARLIL